MPVSLPVQKSQNIKHSFSLTSELKTSYQIMQEKIFSWSQSDLKVVSLYSFMNEKNNIFHDNWRKNKDIIFKLSVHMYHWVVKMHLQTILIALLMTSKGPKISKNFELQ